MLALLESREAEANAKAEWIAGGVTPTALCCWLASSKLTYRPCWPRVNHDQGPAAQPGDVPADDRGDPAPLMQLTSS